MKVALVHEFLTQYGGAERVLEVFLEIFPNATIYTLIYNEEKMGKYFNKYNIKTSFIQNRLFAKNKSRWYLPWMPTAIESFNLNKYDLILSDASAFAKGVITKTNQLHICYCHTPTRYLWEDTHDYINDAKVPWPANKFLPYILNYLRIWDYNAAQRPNLFIANSNFVKNRIKRYYHRDSSVIYPFVYSDKFKPINTKKDYYLVAGRMVPYKRYDIAIKTFNHLKNKKLYVVGDGPYEKYLKNLAISKNIVFLGRVNDKKLAKLYSEAKAYIFPPEEDFGITPLEAMVSGTPVIAYGKGGALETVINNKTGIFFDKQEPESLAKAIKKFEKLTFNKKNIVEHAKKFDKKIFKSQIKEYINKNIKLKFKEYYGI